MFPFSFKGMDLNNRDKKLVLKIWYIFHILREGGYDSGF